MTRRIIFWIKILVSVVLLTLMLTLVKPELIWVALKSARFDLVAIGAALMPVNIWTQEAKWRYLVRLVKPEATAMETTGSLLGGFAFGVVTPGRIGEYGRSLLIKDTSPLKLVGLTAIDKFYNLGCTIAFGLPALMTLPLVMGLIRGQMFVSLMILMLIVDLALLYLALDPRPIRSLVTAIQIIFPNHKRVTQLARGLDRFGPRQARVTLLWTLGHYVIYLLQYFFILSGFFALPIIVACRGAAAILFTKSALPIAIGDLGLDQLVSVQFFGQFGAPAEAAFNASLALFGINVLIPAVVGIFFMSKLQLGQGKNSEPAS